jgi:AcrR family transcriptional regulator
LASSTNASNRNKGGHRTQAQRSATTQQKIVDGAVACVADGGFGAATMAAVADRAGVTVGAIQHQFVDKDGLRVAVLEHGLQRLAAVLDEIESTGDSTESQVSALVSQLWAGYREPDFRAVIEVLRSMRETDPDTGRVVAYLDRVRQMSDAAWARLFPDGGVARDRRLAAQRLVFGALNGLALEQFLVGAPPDDAALERSVLVDAVAGLLGPGASSEA